MKKILLAALTIAISQTVYGQTTNVNSPDGMLTTSLILENGKPFYSIAYMGQTMIEKSELGLETDVWNLSEGLVQKSITIDTTAFDYKIETIKKSHITGKATHAKWLLQKDGKDAVELEFMIENNDIAFRYNLLPVKFEGQENPRSCAFIFKEKTSWNFPSGCKTFFSKQMKGQSGWARTAPSYELPYEAEKETGIQNENIGYIFPGLVKITDKGWVLFGETGVNGAYCGSHFNSSSKNGYTLEFPMKEDFNFNGTSEPGIPLPGSTPWRTITVGNTLKPIAETTIAWDFVEPLYSPSKKYEYCAGTWSWIIGFDESVNYDCQKEYIDLAAQMNFCSVLVDNFWDTQIGHQGIEKLAAYAKSKNVGLFLWYNSNGYWNDAPQGPKHLMNNIIRRRQEMKWMKENGIKGIKVDFFGSDKQVTMQLYEDILADANDFGLQVIFHGCTLPRGWEKMYPNFVGAEAVLASENLHFGDDFNKVESYNATIHPLCRNSLASMDFGGTTFNRYYNSTNDSTMWGGKRVTSDIFQMSVAILFQVAINHTALAPRCLKETEQWKLDFLRKIPTTWDDTKFIAGYPGKYLVLARKHGDKWYTVAINAQNTPLKMKLNLSFMDAQGMTLYSDNATLQGSIKQINKNKKSEYEINVPKDGAYIFVN